MKQYEIDNIRSVVTIGHGGSGKTSLAEAVIFNAGAINRLGRVEEGNTVMDFLPEEMSRNNSTSLAAANFDWKGTQFNMVDTPGYQDFIADALFALSVCEGALLVASAVSGVRVQTEKLWRKARENGIPAVAFINMMDRERANFRNAVDDIKTVLKANPVPIQIPIGAENSFEGVIDLISMKAL